MVFMNLRNDVQINWKQHLKIFRLRGIYWRTRARCKISNRARRTSMHICWRSPRSVCQHHSEADKFDLRDLNHKESWKFILVQDFSGPWTAGKNQRGELFSCCRKGEHFFLQKGFHRFCSYCAPRCYPLWDGQFENKSSLALHNAHCYQSKSISGEKDEQS